MFICCRDSFNQLREIGLEPTCPADQLTPVSPFTDKGLCRGQKKNYWTDFDFVPSTRYLVSTGREPMKIDQVVHLSKSLGLAVTFCGTKGVLPHPKMRLVPAMGQDAHSDVKKVTSNCCCTSHRFVVF